MHVITVPSINVESLERLKLSSHIEAWWFVSVSLQIFTFNITFSLFSWVKIDETSLIHELAAHGSTGSPSGLVGSKQRNGSTDEESSIELTSSVTGAWIKVCHFYITQLYIKSPHFLFWSPLAKHSFLRKLKISPFIQSSI